jgi:hypothetical protein
MTYFVDVFSVATYEEFSCTDKAQAGFTPSVAPGSRKSSRATSCCAISRVFPAG